MMNIDIKTVLLKSLSSNKVMRGNYRLHFGKSCFIIKFEVKGKFLTITNIRKILRKPLTWRQRLQRKLRLQKLYLLKVRNYRYKQNAFAKRDRHLASLKVTEVQKMIIDNVVMQTKEIQTLYSRIPPKTISVTTETKNISLTTSAQQTIASTRYQLKRLIGGQSQSPKTFTVNLNKSCQTELNTETKGIQCKRLTLCKATQTVVHVLTSSYTQVWDDLVNLTNLETDNQTLETTLTKSDLSDNEAVVYMLNEIGELVLNQNQILNNNTKMLGQISERAMLTKMVDLGKAWRKRTFKKNEINGHQRPCNEQHLPVIKSFKMNRSKEIDVRHKSIQTERIVKPEMLQKSTQTTTGSSKPQKFSLFWKKR